METSMAAIIVAAQGHDTAGRKKTYARASTASEARPWKRQRMNSHRGAPSAHARPKTRACRSPFRRRERLNPGPS